MASRPAVLSCVRWMPCSPLCPGLVGSCLSSGLRHGHPAGCLSPAYTALPLRPLDPPCVLLVGSEVDLDCCPWASQCSLRVGWSCSPCASRSLGPGFVPVWCSGDGPGVDRELVWPCPRPTPHVACPTWSPFSLQVNVPRCLPFSGVGTVKQAACGGTGCALLNGETPLGSHWGLVGMFTRLSGSRSHGMIRWTEPGEFHDTCGQRAAHPVTPADLEGAGCRVPVPSAQPDPFSSQEVNERVGTATVCPVKECVAH